MFLRRSHSTFFSLGLLLSSLALSDGGDRPGSSCENLLTSLNRDRWIAIPRAVHNQVEESEYRKRSEAAEQARSQLVAARAVFENVHFIVGEYFALCRRQPTEARAEHWARALREFKILQKRFWAGSEQGALPSYLSEDFSNMGNIDIAHYWAAGILDLRLYRALLVSSFLQLPLDVALSSVTSELLAQKVKAANEVIREQSRIVFQSRSTIDEVLGGGNILEREGYIDGLVENDRIPVEVREEIRNHVQFLRSLRLPPDPAFLNLIITTQHYLNQSP